MYTMTNESSTYEEAVQLQKSTDKIEDHVIVGKMNVCFYIHHIYAP